MNLHSPLQYRISEWSQLSGCVSNMSRQLSITVTKIVNNDVLEGTRIVVNHEKFGPVFAYVVGATGNLINPMDNNQLYELTPGQIIQELKKYGFYVNYQPAKGLSGNQLSYLMTIRGLNFDKLRVIDVWSATTSGERLSKRYIVAFLSSKNGDWLNSGYSPSELEFNLALKEGSAVNLSAISQANNYDWSWLKGWVANIDDILNDAAGV